jgi:cytochrome P450
LKINLPESKKSDESLTNETITFIGVGSHTVAWRLTVASYHILTNPSILQKFKADSRTVKEEGMNEAQVLAELE